MKKILVIVLSALILLGGGGFATWYFLIRSDPEPRAKIERTTVVEGGALDGTYQLAAGGADSFVGYRVQETFAAAVIESTATGRTAQVQGSLSIQGATIDSVDFTADLRTLTSDREQRDSKIRTDGLESDRFPDATFKLTKPIQLDQVPAAGETVTATATGDFTLHGVTRSVQIPVEGRWDGARLQVVGNLPILFSDYDIKAPNIGGFVSVRDEGEMEFQLFLERS